MSAYRKELEEKALALYCRVHRPKSNYEYHTQSPSTKLGWERLVLWQERIEKTNKELRDGIIRLKKDRARLRKQMTYGWQESTPTVGGIF